MSLGANKQALMGAAGAAGGAGDGFYSHQIASSIRNSAAQSGTLKWTAGTPTSRTQFTMSYWVKRYNTSGGSSSNLVYTSGSSGGAYMFWGFSVADFDFQVTGGNWSTGYLTSDNMYRDTSAWYHHVITFDSTQSTQADRLKIYVNGERITSFSVESVTAGIGASEDFSFINQSGIVQAFGGLSAIGHGTEGADNQMAEIVFNDGQAYGPDSYGETKNGVWIPKDPSGLTFGNNGYWLKMASGAIGTDSSGNGNTFTVTNIAAHDVMLDSPTFNSDSNGGNFATLGPLWKNPSELTLSEGNLRGTASTGGIGAMSNWAVPASGKWYWEVNYSDQYSTGTNFLVGIAYAKTSLTAVETADQIVYYSENGMKIVEGTRTAGYGVAFDSPNGDAVVGVAVDRVNNTLNFSYNGSWQGTIDISGLSSNEFFPYTGFSGVNGTQGCTYNFGQDGTFAGNFTAQGNTDDTGYGDFKYAVPTGFLAMCAGNLPVADAVDPAQTDDDYPQELFFMSKYTGNLTNRTITTENQPDLIWNRQSNNAQDWYVVDSTRGITANKYILTNTTAAEATLPQGNFTSVGATSVGISSGTWLNSTGADYKMWMWRANGGTTAANSVGGTSSVTQIDPSGGFSIVTYSGTGSATTIGHGLSVVPTMIITKRINSTSDWTVYHQYMNTSPQTSYLKLSKGEAMGTGDSGYWNSTAPTSSVFSLGTANDVNASGGTYIAYCFANTEGYINARSYVGNANNDGTFVYTGFKPAFVMNKPIVAGNWRLVDSQRSPYNVTQNALSPNLSDAQDTYDSTNIDLLSNGFKMRNYETPMNQATTYIYLAFAENPFKYATAR